MAKQTITSGKAPIVWSTVEDAFTKINANFTELYASIGETGSIGFDALETDLIPVDNDTYDLGAPNKRWSNLYLSDTLQIGGAAISNQGLTLDLPSGTTVGGNLIIDPNKSFFKEFSVNNDTSIVADQFNDVLDFNAGTGIQLTVTSTNDQINITNTGVTSLVAGYGMSVNSSTGVVTISNAGVRSVTAGDGMEIVDSSATGDITIHNNGVLTLSAGPSITLSNGGLPDSDGKIIITNSAPAGAAYRFITVSGEATLTAPSLAGTLTLIEGSGINITTAPASGTLNNRVTFENTGVLSLTAGAGLIESAATGAVTVSFNNRVDIIGSVFADDSTMLVDGTGARIVGDVYTSTLRTSEPRISLGDGAGSATFGAAIAIGQYAGNTNQSSTGLGLGFRAAFSNQGSGAVAIGVDAGYATQGASAVALGNTAGKTSQGANAIAIGNKAGETSQTAGSIVINASGVALNSAAAGFYVDPVRNDNSTGNVLTYNTTTREIIYSSVFDGDVTGSVFSDGSTMLIDGTEGKVVGPVDSATVKASSYIQTGVYADLSAIAAAIPTAVKGMIVFDDDTNQFRGFDGASWVALN